MRPIRPLLVPSLACLVGAASAADQVAPPLVVSATRLDDDPFVQPYALYDLDADALRREGARSPTEALDLTPGVRMQETAPNQASPYIRGLTGEQTLLLFDGVRLNHAMNRPGPNQYAGLLPSESVGRIDTILGSTSAITGSDGLTGAIDFRLAEAGRGVGKAVSPWVGARIATAEGEQVGGGVDGVAGDWAYSLDGSLANYGDLRGGDEAGEHLFGPAAGEREIPNTGFDQHHYAGRVAWLGLERNRFELAAGQTVQSDAPRPDGYFENSGAATRISREYERQEFDYAHLRHVVALDGAVDRVQTTLWFHRQLEDQRREDVQTSAAGALQRYRRREYDDVVDSIGADLQLTSLIDTHEVTYGGTAYLDEVSTDMNRYRPPGGFANGTPGALDPDNAVLDQTGEDNPGATTVPDGAEYLGLALFVQDSWQVTDQWNVLAGVRYSRTSWDFTVTDDRAGFDFIDPLVAANPDAELDVDESVDAVTGNVRVAWTPAPAWMAFAGVGQGFRAPNISNLAGIQDRGSASSGGTGPQVIGDLDLDPETSITYEVGGRWREDRDEVGASAFVTTLDDLIQVVYDDVDGDGDIDAADSAQLVNGEDGLLAGFEVASDIGIPTGSALPEGWRLSVFQSTSLVSGEVDVPLPSAGGEVEEQNISRANLLFGRAGLMLDMGGVLWTRSQVRWQDRYDEPAPGDATDTRHTTFPAMGGQPGSMPGWAVWDWHVGVRLPKDRLWFTLGVENLLDHTYRPVGSGSDGPGLNVVFAGGARF